MNNVNLGIVIESRGSTLTGVERTTNLYETLSDGENELLTYFRVAIGRKHWV